VSGVAGIGDRLRSDARATVEALKARGIRVRILSGDQPEVVARVGARLGLAAEDARGGLTPEAKRDLVSRLVERREAPGAVVMVGDGVNDAAALALADVGIAVHGGTGASIVAADIVLTRAGVGPLLDVLDGAGRLRAVIRRNIAASLVYNLAASSLAVLGLVGPLLAAVLMPVSSLTVLLSSAFSRTFGPRPQRPAEAAGVAAGEA
jgi:Cu2+-exporting ATPase